MKKALIIAAALIPAIIVFVAMTSERPGEPAETVVEPVVKEMAVEGTIISKGKLVGTVEVSGTVEGTAEAFVIAQLGGTIATVNVDLGEYVREGDVLAALADEGEDFTLGQAAAQLENAKREFAATENLHAKGASSEADLTRARSALNGAEAAYKRALDARDSRVLDAPVSGFIADLDPAVAVGNVLNPGTRVARIVDLSALKMRASLGQRQMNLVDRNAPATMYYSDTLGLDPSPANVTAVAAGADPSTGAYRIIIEGANTHRLTRSGMTATARIETNETPELLVPAAALVTRNGVVGGFVERDGEAFFTTIETGKRFGDYYTVVQGLEEGDVLLTSGTTTLVNGDPVAVTIRESVRLGK
jgi:membrane fusion protein (multidrug efflux system)